MDFQTLAPCFLIAMPELADPNFKHSVVLLTEVNESGASGFIINHPTQMMLGQTIVLPDGKLRPDCEDIKLWFGGPVDEDKIWIVYDSSVYQNPDDLAISEQVILAKNLDMLVQEERPLDTGRLRIFHGYAGWSTQQLESEIAVSAWLTAPLDKSLIFDTHPNDVWETAIKSLGFEPDKLVGPNSPFLN